ncbi:hypothetical protein HK405_014956, partial [Cladochytrium tenue]
TVAPILGALGYHMKRYPGFGGNVEIELFEDQKSGGGWLAGRAHYVRAKYNGSAIVVPQCAKQGAHYTGDPTMCKFSAFSAALRELVPADFKRECK